MLRAVAFSAAFLLGSCSTWAVAEWAVAHGANSRVGIPLDIIESVKSWQAESAADTTHERIAFIGDSVLLSAAGEPSIPGATEAALHAMGGRSTLAKLHLLATPGGTVVTQYFLADELIRAKPDRVVLELNLRNFGPTPLGAFAFPELSGWVSPERLPELLRLPIAEAGLTLDRLLFYQLLVQEGLDGLWAFVVDRQVKLYDARHWLEGAIDERLGRRAFLERWVMHGVEGANRLLAPGTNRMRPELIRATLGNPLTGLEPRQPRMRFLAALLERFQEAGIPTLLWVSPVNVDYLEDQGIDPTPLRRSVAVLSRLAGEHDARLLDLHSALGDADFRDHADHVRSTGRPAATERIGQLIARAISYTTPRLIRRELASSIPRSTDAVQ